MIVLNAGNHITCSVCNCILTADNVFLNKKNDVGYWSDKCKKCRSHEYYLRDKERAQLRQEKAEAGRVPAPLHPHYLRWLREQFDEVQRAAVRFPPVERWAAGPEPQVKEKVKAIPYNCPSCGCVTWISGGRTNADGRYIRHRNCRACGAKFTTYYNDGVETFKGMVGADLPGVGAVTGPPGGPRVSVVL